MKPLFAAWNKLFFTWNSDLPVAQYQTASRDFSIELGRMRATEEGQSG
jgi:hypothetical protein